MAAGHRPASWYAAGMEPRFERVFFDLGGTLLRVRGSVGAVYASAAARHGVHADAEAVERAFRVALTASPPATFPGVAAAAIPMHERAWWRHVVATTFASFAPFDDFEAFFDEVFAFFARPDAWELLPGAQSLLAQLQAEGRRLGIVSEMDSRVYAILEAFDVRRHFDVIALSTECGAVKTDGGLFRVALRMAAVPPSVCLHLGDSPAADAGGAGMAGITASLLGSDAAPRLQDVPESIRALEHGAAG